MKRTLLATVAVIAASSVFAQGTIKIENNNTIKSDGSGTYRIPFFVDITNNGIQDAGELGVGTYAQQNGLGRVTFGLFTVGSTTPFAQAFFRTDANGAFLSTETAPGIVAAGTTVTVPGHAAGTRPTLIARVWSGSSFWTAPGPVILKGEYIFQVGLPLGGDPGGGATPILPSGLAGLGNEVTSAPLQVGIFMVPEPSTIALGTLGIGALLLAVASNRRVDLFR